MWYERLCGADKVSVWSLDRIWVGEMASPGHRQIQGWRENLAFSYVSDSICGEFPLRNGERSEAFKWLFGARWG